MGAPASTARSKEVRITTNKHITLAEMRSFLYNELKERAIVISDLIIENT